jgi:hypothetical protein
MIIPLLLFVIAVLLLAIFCELSKINSHLRNTFTTHTSNDRDRAKTLAA